MVQTCLMFFVISICMSACVIAKGKTWFEAQQFCHNKTQKLITDTSNEPKTRTFWTGHHISLSRWIKVLGCYDEDTVANHTAHSVKMKHPSHGLCQEECHLLERLTFGIKNDSCVCLQRPIQGASVSPIMCNYTCNESTNIKFSTACGGINTYNLFQTDVCEADHTRHVDLCLAIECEQFYKNFTYDKCSKPYGKVCKSAANDESWTESMTSCIKSGSYIFADIDISNITSACLEVKKIRSKSGPAWLGIAKQQFISIDRGAVIPEGKKSIITECETCSNKSCKFRKCTDAINTTVKCVNIPRTTSTVETTAQMPCRSAQTTTSVRATMSTTPISMSTSMQTTTMPNSTEEGTVKDNNSTYSNADKTQRSDSDPRILVTILVPVVLLIIIGGVLWFFVYKRRQKKEQKDECSDVQMTALDFQINNSINKESDNSNNKNGYFVIEPANSCYEIAESSRDEAENPYIEGKEGIYDHLRDTESRRKATDDMYQHTPFVQNSDLPDYDFTRRTKNQESEDTYDHAKMQKTNSSTEYDTLQRDQEDCGLG